MTVMLTGGRFVTGINVIVKSPSRVSRFRGFIIVVPLFVASTLLLSTVGSLKAAEEELTPAEQQLIEKIKQEVMKELREGKFLRQQIEQGIQDYFEKQQQAEDTARAEEERLANENLQANNVCSGFSPRGQTFGNPQRFVCH